MARTVHTLNVEELFLQLKSSHTGLNDDEARRRYAEYGPNRLQNAENVSARRLLFGQFRNLLIVILLVATLLSAFLGHALEAIAIGVIVLFAVLLGFVQEYRAGKAIEALRSMAAPQARVIRNGLERLVPSEELVPGDIILIAAGDRVPADGRLLEAQNLRIEEASLTGESLPSEKEASDSLPPDTSVGDQRNMVFAGTSAVYGRGRAIVTSIGMETEFGRIASLLQNVETEKTPLQVNLDRVGANLGRAALVIVFFIVAIGLLRGRPFIEILVFGIALAVAVVPEALPAVVTISLALGVQRMARRHALMRHLPAVEALGSTTVICTDKTGTLTRNEMTVRALYADGVVAGVTGSGYSPEGDLSLPDGEGKQMAVFMRLLEAGALCNDARLAEDAAGGWSVSGDPTEAALIVVAMKAGLDDSTLRARYPRVSEEPFSSEAKRMLTVHRDGDDLITIVKGAPETVLFSCTHQLRSGGITRLDPADISEILRAAEQMSGDALRVLAIASKVEHAGDGGNSELTFLGLAGMIDPPRAEARDAVRQCIEAGIRPVMITGDHPVTARTIASELGIFRNGRVMTGTELQDLEQSELMKVVGSVEVFARVAPEQKLRIVEALQAAGEVVAMTGDGVNDAPALRKADIGISMGISGTDVAREASVMTLTDDNFASIVAAIDEGRSIYDNISKYLTYLLSSNIGELGLMSIATLAGLPLPLSAVQILYVNLATDGLPSLALAVDPAEPGIMKRRPRDPKQGIFTSPLVALMLAGGIWSTVVNVVLFRWALASGRTLAESMTMTFVSLVLIQFFKAYNFRSGKKSIRMRPFANRWLNLSILWEISMLVAIVYLPFMRALFGTFMMSAADWVIITSGAMTVIPVIESVKWAIRKGLFAPDV
jgi:Ca2+-transporting ATPase